MSKSGDVGVIISFVAMALTWITLAVAPTVGVIWIACHFIRKFW